MKKKTLINKIRIAVSLLMIVALASSWSVNVFAQGSAGESVKEYIPSRLRALDRDIRDRREAALSKDAVPLTAKQKLDKLVAEYVAEGYTLVTASASAIIPLVDYYDDQGLVTDKYRFYTGRIGTSTDENAPSFFAHLGNVNKFIAGSYQKTTYGNGSTISRGYNLLPEEQALHLERNYNSTVASDGTMPLAGSSYGRFLFKELEAVGNRGPSHEIIYLSMATATSTIYQTTYNNLKGVLETRMYPDDYIPNIYTEYKFYFTDDHDGNAYFVCHVDNMFGPNDYVPIYRQANKRGMYMEAQMEPATGDTETYRFSYTIPKLRGREPKQYMGAYLRDQTYKPFGGRRDGDGGEVATNDILLPNGVGIPRTDAAMFFKNKGKHYVSGDVFTTTLVQGVSAIILPELEFDGGYLDFDSPKGHDFDLEDVGLIWIDTNAGDKSVHGDETEDNISLGGIVKYIKMDGADEVGDWTTVGTYTRTKIEDPTMGDLDYLSETSYIIPASELKPGRNVFKFTITNNVRQAGEIVNTSNIYIVTINVPYVVDVIYKTLNGTVIAPPTDYQTHFEGELGDLLVVTFPKSYKAYDFRSVVPNVPVVSLDENTNKIVTEFSDGLETIVLNYFSNEVEVTISFRRAGTNDGKIYQDITANLETVEDHVVSVEVGKNIEQVVQALVTSGDIKLNFKGYNEMKVSDYVVEGMPTKPTEVPNQATRIIYNYSGTRRSLK